MKKGILLFSFLFIYFSIECQELERSKLACFDNVFNDSFTNKIDSVLLDFEKNFNSLFLTPKDSLLSKEELFLKNNYLNKIDSLEFYFTKKGKKSLNQSKKKIKITLSEIKIDIKYFKSELYKFENKSPFDKNKKYSVFNEYASNTINCRILYRQYFYLKNKDQIIVNLISKDFLNLLEKMYGKNTLDKVRIEKVFDTTFSFVEVCLNKDLSIRYVSFNESIKLINNKK